jgi:hypothetical protein
MTFAVLLALVLFVYREAFGIQNLDLVPRLTIWIGGLVLLDVLIFDGRGDGTRRAAIETQEEGLKWMEGMEIGNMAWTEIAAGWLFEPGGAAAAEAAGSQRSRLPRRLLLRDAVGRLMFIEEADGEFDRFLLRLAHERPDLALPRVSPEHGTESSAS